MSLSRSDAARLAAVQQKKPPKADLFALVGEENVTHTPDGKWEARIPPEKMRAFHELTQPWREAEIAAHGEIQAREPDVSARLKATGERRYMKQSDEYHAGRRGKLAALRTLVMTVPDLPWKKAKRG